MKTLNDISEYYRLKYLKHTEGIDKADYDGIMIGIYLTLAAVTKSAINTTHKDVGYYADLEHDAMNALDRAYYDEELYG